MSRWSVAQWFGLMVIGLAAPIVVAGHVPIRTEAEVERAVIAAIPVWHGQKATILKYLDLAQPFDTASPWALVVARDPNPPAEPDMEDHGPIDVCLVKTLTPDCVANYAQRWAGAPSWYFEPYHLFDLKVTYAGRGRTKPLLMIKTCSARSGDGNCNIRTVLYQYSRQSDSFRKVFVSESGGSNNNEAAHFVEDGPLQGDEIVDFPTDNPPYVYWVEVFAPGKSGQYARILRYRSITHYNDGNPLPVADSEMPEIMERLGLWKPGDALPIPAQAPPDCGRLVLRHGEEWCKKFPARK